RSRGFLRLSGALRGSITKGFTMSKPTIAVIGGTGAEGSGLAFRWAAAGYAIILGSRSAEKAAQSAAELAAKLPADAGSIHGAANADAAAAAEIIVLSVPYDAQV